MNYDRYREQLPWLHLGVALLSGTCFFVLLYVLINPDHHAHYHGVLFSNLSLAPFDFSTENPARYRILGPLVGYISGLKGDRFYLLPWICSWLSCVLSVWILLRHGIGYLGSLSGAGVLVFSGLVILPLMSPGYTDSLTWLLLLASLIPGLGNGTLALLLLVALFNHEAAVFAWPGIILWNFRTKPWKQLLRWCLIWLLPGVLLYILFRYAVSSLTTVKYGMDFYVNRWNIINNLAIVKDQLPESVYHTFRLAWIFPLLASLIAWSRKSYTESIAVLCMTAVPFLQLLVAYDVSRLVCLAFPGIIVSMIISCRAFPAWMPKMILLVFLFNLMMPFYLTGSTMRLKVPLIVEKIEWRGD